jgi:hypothetical protein
MNLRVKRLLPTVFSILFVSFILVSCRVDTSSKKLSSKDAALLPEKPKNTSDAIGVRFAYRDTADTANTWVVIQGFTSSNAKLSTPCGTNASNCSCDFYTSATGTAIAAASVDYTESGNFISCKIPTGTTPSTITYVRLKQISGDYSTGQMNVQTDLTLGDILPAGHVRSKIRNVYTYSCTKYYFTGSGIGPNGINCYDTAFKWSFVYADYNYFLYEAEFNPSDSSKSGTTSQRSGIGYYSQGQAICGNIPVIEFNCSGHPDTELFGLYAEATDLFNVRVTLPVGPDKANQFVGFAALSDGAGNCPSGLAKLGIYVARPNSYTTLPSRFVNENGSLNNELLAPIPYSATSTFPPDFEVKIIASTTTCTAAGICAATMGSPVDAQTDISYSSSNLTPPYYCGIPKDEIK